MTLVFAPVRYRPEVEDVKRDEQQTIERLCMAFDTILATTAEDYGHAVRAVHAKSHGILEGTLTIEPHLSPELSQGLFSRPGTHKVYLRLSTSAGDILPDAISLPRGLAIKVLNVEGERLPDAEGTTQDFVMVNDAIFPAETADQFLSSLQLLAKTTGRIEVAKKVLSAALRGLNSALGTVGMENPKIAALGGAPNVDPLGETYYSITPFRYGDYIAKFSVAPISPDLTVLSGTKINARSRPDAIRETVQTEMRNIDGVWEFRAQLARDLAKQPIEDPTVEWSEAEAPFQRVGIITAHRQDSWNPELVVAVDQKMRFSVWTGLAAHQPLGNINRARKVAYQHSADFRAKFNGCPLHEPSQTK